LLISLSSGKVRVNPHVDEDGKILETSLSNHMLGFRENPIGGISDAPVANVRTLGKSISTLHSSTLACLPPEIMGNTLLIQKKSSN
jgi:hypothetical protein